ncbi:glycosyltransferase [Streptococcus thermophilus]|nr:glycosyltransferase [Streptococcus thermophilus]MCE2128649.1 glycosyltransferase [Streptococcus thermophilus]
METVKLNCHQSSDMVAMIDLAIVAIIKNEGQYIEEWLRYHIVAGVQKFFLYDNDSSDNTREILEKYIRAGYVELIPYPGAAKQLPAYNDALAKHRYDCRYIAFIDADEFLYSCNKLKNVRDFCN